VTIPSDYLAAADRLLLEVVPGARGTWPRAAAWLMRLALETALTGFWTTASPQVAECRSRRAQLLLLREHVSIDIARRADYAWNALSRAGHHHSYELALSASELNALRTEVQAVVSALGTV
jgi:hypothetical protein